MQILHVQCDREAYVNCKPSTNTVYWRFLSGLFLLRFRTLWTLE